jgi:C4-dicarboxylate transporter DctM subunit
MFDMSNHTIGIIGTVIAVGLMMIDVPIGLSFFLGGVAGLAMLMGPAKAVTIMGSIPYDTFHRYTLMALPAFLLMGEICTYGNMSRDLFDCARKWVGHVRGGLAMASVAGCAAFGSVAGGSMSTAAALAPICMPEMKRFGVSDRLAAGTVASAGTLGALIPPSGIYIWIGVLADLDIGKLFVASLIPGALLTLMMMAQIWLQVKLKPDLAPRLPSVPWKDRFKSLPGVVPLSALLIFVLGGLFLGVFTPTEAGSAGVFGALALTVVYRSFSFKMVVNSIAESGKVVVRVLMILMGAMVFQNFLALSQLPQVITKWIIGLPVPPVVTVMLLMAFYLPLGTFMDTLSMLILTAPLFFPVVVGLGLDPYWFGILVVVAMEIAQVSPPEGITVFVVQSATGIPMGEVFAGCWAFAGTMILSLALMIAFPAIVTVLPSLMTR